MLTHINVTLRYQSNAVDVRLPIRMVISELIRELQLIFDWPLMHDCYHFRVVTKGLVLEGDRQLQHYPVTTGDILEIEEG